MTLTTVHASNTAVTIADSRWVPGRERAREVWGPDHDLGRAVWIFGRDGDPRRAHKRFVNPDRHARIRMRHYDNAYWALDEENHSSEPQGERQVRMAIAAWDAFEAIMTCQWGCS